MYYVTAVTNKVMPFSSNLEYDINWILNENYNFTKYYLKLVFFRYQVISFSLCQKYKYVKNIIAIQYPFKRQVPEHVKTIAYSELVSMLSCKNQDVLDISY